MLNEQIDPFEFDTQARQELYSLDNGSLPDKGNVTFDTNLRDGHDYRYLRHAHEYMELIGCESEPDTKGPFIITNARRRVNELFYDDVMAHNNSVYDEYDNDWAIATGEFVEDLSEEDLMEHQEEKRDHWDSKHESDDSEEWWDENDENDTNDPEVMQETLEKQAITERIKLLDIKGDLRDDRKGRKIWENIDKQLSFADKKQLAHLERERQTPEKTRSKRRRNEKLDREILARDYNETWEEDYEERFDTADVIQMDMEISDAENAAKERVDQKKAA